MNLQEILGPVPVDNQGFFPYLEEKAIAHKTHHKSVINQSQVITTFKRRCAPNYIEQYCKAGDSWFKAIFCGLPWCARCGEVDSPTHKRRYARSWSRIITDTVNLGQLVITFPSQCGNLLYSPKFLKAARTFLTRYLKRHGIAERGCSIWHWESSTWSKWFPHLNYLFEAAHLPKHQLNRLRADFTAWLKNKWHIAGFDSAVIHYEYAQTVERKIHMLKYNTRPTLHHYSHSRREVYDAVRGLIWFGKFEKRPAAMVQIEAADPEGAFLQVEQNYLNTLGRGFCPAEGLPVKSRFRPAGDVFLGQAIEMIPGALWYQKREAADG